MKLRDCRRKFWLLLTGVATFGTRARALEANDVLSYSLGPLILRPQLELSERYDSNIFYQQQNVVGDFRTDVMPGLNLVLGKNDRFALSLNYLLDKSHYLENDQLDSLGHLLSSQLTFQRARLWVQGSDRVQILENQVLSQELNFQNSTNRAGYTTQNDTYLVGYRLSEKTAVYVQGNHDSFDYSKNTTVLDYDNLSGTVGFQKAVFGKTKLFGEVYYGQTATAPNTTLLPKSPHSEFIGGFVGATGDFTEKLSGQIKAGYESRSFSGDGGGVSGIVVGSAINYRMTEKRSLALQYNRRSNVSVQNGTAPYVADIVGLNFQQAIGTRGKWLARSSVGYASYAYQGIVFASRVDSLYSIGTNLDYFFQPWLKATFGYNFTKYESQSGTGANFGVANYDFHQISLRLALGY